MKRIDLKALIIACLFVLLTTGVIWASPVTHTGLTNCYDDKGNILDPCPLPGQSFFGQDANFVINSMSYTKLDENGYDLPDSATVWKMVRDNVTGLIWEIKNQKDKIPDYGDTQDADNTYTWYNNDSDSNGGDPGTKDSFYDTEVFINTLNSNKYGGFSDWRLPNVNELNSIVNYRISSSEPTIDVDFFQNTYASNYWSATYFYDPDLNEEVKFKYAWAVSFYNGYDYYNLKSNKLFVRAVHGLPSSSKFLINNENEIENGTVTDISTGLMWQREIEKYKMNWKDALHYCTQLNIAGYGDWRLPTEKELKSLVDYRKYDPTINTDIFPETASYSFWSSTTDTASGYTNYAWAVHFTEGYDLNLIKSNLCFVRAVRGGYSAPIPKCRNVIISAGSSCSIDASDDTSIDNGSYDTAGREIITSQTPSDPYSVGSTPVTLSVTNSQGQSNQCKATVTVFESTPPKITNASASPSMIWPANGKMVDININYDAVDNCCQPSCRISSVTSNESITGSDYIIVDVHNVQLRADRLKPGAGRIYTVTVTCTDTSGNTSNQSVNVTVPIKHKTNGSIFSIYNRL